MGQQDEKIIISIEINEKDVTQRLGETAKAISDLKDKNKVLKKEMKDGTADWAEASKSVKENEAQIKLLTATEKQLSGQLSILTADNKKYGDSNVELRAQVLELERQYNSLSKEQKNSEGGKAMLAMQNELKNKVKESAESLGNFQDSVGNYGKALEGVGGAAKKLPGAFGTMASGAMGAADSLKAMNAASPVGWVIIIVGLINTFTDKLKSNADFAKGYAVVMGGLNAIFSMFSGYVVKSLLAVGDFIGSIKSFPDLLSKVGAAIKENLINRLESFSVMGKAIVKILSGDLKQGFKELGNGVIQATVGVTGGIDKMSNAAKAIGSEIAKANEEGQKLVKLEKAYGKAQRESLTALATLEGKAAQAQQAMSKLAANASSIEEQKKAFREFESTQSKILKIKLDLLSKDEAISAEKLRIETKNTGNALGATKLEFEEKKAARIRALDEYELLTKNSSLREEKMMLTILKNQIKFYEDGAKANKKSQTEILSDNNSTFEQKRSAVAKMAEIDDQNYKIQLQALNKFAGGKINVQKIIDTVDEKAAFDLVRNSGIALGAQTELIAIIQARKAAVVETAAANKKVSQEELDALLSRLKQETEVSKLQLQEQNAGKKFSFAERKKMSDDALLEDYQFNLKTLEAKKTDETKFLEDKKLLDQKYKTDKAVSDAEFTKAEKDRKLSAQASDLQNEAAIQAAGSDALLEIKKKQLDAQLAAELSAAETNGQNKQAIEEKYSKMRIDLEEETANTKLQLESDLAGKIADLAGKNTVIGKAAAIAQIGIDTYVGAMKAYAAFAYAPPLAILASGVVIAAGAKSAAKVAGIGLKFADGGIVPGNSFKGDKVVARLNSGEMILNTEQQTKLFNAIASGSITQNNNSFDYKALAAAIAAQKPPTLNYAEFREFQQKVVNLDELIKI